MWQVCTYQVLSMVRLKKKKKKKKPLSMDENGYESC